MRRLAIVLAGAALPLHGGAAMAQDSAAEVATEDGVVPMSHIRLYASADASAFSRTPVSNGNAVTADGVAGIEFAAPLGGGFEVAVSPELRWSAGTGNTGNAVRLVDDGLDRPLFTLAEAWIAKQSGPFRIKLGKQVRSWGTSELYSPSDDLNAHDQLDPPEAYKIGEPMAVVTYSARDFAIEALVIPWFTPDRLPVGSNPWARSTRRVADAVEQATGRRPEVFLGDRDLPDGFKPVQFGGRVTSSTLLRGTDLFVSGFRGISRVPVLLPRLETIRLIYLDADYPGYVELATGFSTVAGSFEVHGEAAWHLTDRSERNDDYVAFVLGARREFYPAGAGPLSTVRLTLEYAGEVVTRHKAANSEYISTPFDRPVPNSLIARLTLEFGGDTSFTAGTIVNLDDGDYAFESGVSHRLFEGVTVKTGVRMFGGPRDTYFGEWRDNDEAYASLALTL